MPVSQPNVASVTEVGPVVVGAGVCGLAVAGELAERGLAPLVIERRGGAGRETSTRNSGVIHAGLYYPRGSAKARLCVRGNRLLYAFCQRAGVEHRRLGKLVVATSIEQVSELEQLADRARDNGAATLELVDGAVARRLEPRVRAEAALVSASTGVVDAHELVKALEARARHAGAEVCYRCVLIAAEPAGDGWLLTLRMPDGQLEALVTPLVVNAAGLDADRVARQLGEARWQLHWCRGDYFAAPRSAAAGVSRLIYPLPSRHGLGVHATLDLGGRLLLGPDTTYIAREPEQPDVDAAKAASFRAAGARYLPHLADVELSPDSWGIRPKLQASGEPVADFVIEPGRASLHLVGIESPGLTASLAIAEEVGGRLSSSGLI
jgi:L-2-hydroxyglutarate oxidase LhgO